MNRAAVSEVPTLSFQQLRDLGIVDPTAGTERLRTETRTRLRFAITTVFLDDEPRWIVKAALGANAVSWLEREHGRRDTGDLIEQ